MNFAQLNINLTALGVVPPDVLRASLYYDYLVAANTFFTATMNTPVGGPPPAAGLGPGYAFVQNAVRATSLLNELAEVLDFFVSPAVEADLQRAYAAPPNGLDHGAAGGAVAWTYRDYFDNEILDVVPLTYNNNLNNFRLRYPIMDHALNRLANNFQNNILEACQRVIADRVLLTNFYNDLYNNTLVINTMERIKSTGSDFHKGGKQVLILTFDITYTNGLLQKRENLKIVYKPSDIEADCLIVGDSAAVNNVIPGFMVNSLFEIYNNRLQAYKAANLGFTGKPLDTYRILPRNYISLYGGGYPLPIRQAYGYIQYLAYDISGVAQQFFGYYPAGESDYLVFRGMNEANTLRTFYNKSGAYTALSTNFSLMDMHVENMRVSNYRPYPIDLEISLTSTVNDVAQTRLIANMGGISGYEITGQDSHWVAYNINNAGNSYVQRDYPTIYYQNRLWRWQANRQKQLIAIDQHRLLQGFMDGMRIIREGQMNGDFNAWFIRLNNVLVRYVPYPTSIFKSLVTLTFISTVQAQPPGGPAPALAATLQAVIRDKLTQEFNGYAMGGGANPNFLAFTPANCNHDYQNLDIPVFYHRIGSQEIVNSLGAQVAIPANITVDNPAAPPPTLNPALAIGRATFFANVPTTANVDVGQVQVLGGVGFAARMMLIQGTIIHGLAGAHPNVIRQVDQ